MVGTRFVRLPISALEAWDAPLETNIDNVLGPNPFAMPEVADETALPSAATMRNCWVMVQDYQSTGLPMLARSDGAAWHIHAPWRDRQVLGADAATWDIIHPLIPYVESFEARLWFEHKSGPNVAPQILLGDSGGMDATAVYWNQRWGCTGGGMAQTSTAGDVALWPMPAAFVSVATAQVAMRITFMKIDATAWSILGDIQGGQGGGGGGPWFTLMGGGFRCNYTGAKTVDRFQIGIPGSVIDSTKAKCELFFN